MVAQWSRAIDRRTFGIAVEAELVVARPAFDHFGVDDDPALGIRSAGETDAQLSANGARAAICGDHIAGPDAFELVVSEVGQHQLDRVGALGQTQALVFEKERDVGESSHARSEDAFHRRLVDELLRRVAVAAVRGQQFDDADAAGVDEVGAGTGQHVGVELVSQPDLLPDPQYLLVGGDGPGPEVDIGVAFHHHNSQAQLAEQVGGGRTHRAIADDRYVVGRGAVHGCLRSGCRVRGGEHLFRSDRYGNVVIATASRDGANMATADKPKRRAKRVDGELSRTRILDAATEIAAERGYEGTSIGAVSAKCGLPASSIYWHFTDKDDLIAAVIERSFNKWMAVWQLPEDLVAVDRLMDVATGTAKALMESPDFLRLGLMLALERRPVEPRARAMFVKVREEAFDALSGSLDRLGIGLTGAQIRELATYAIAGADGLFIAKEIGETQLIWCPCSPCTGMRCTRPRCGWLTRMPDDAVCDHAAESDPISSSRSGSGRRQMSSASPGLTPSITRTPRVALSAACASSRSR